MSYAAHDLALESMAGVGPELRNGAPNHAPMVIEALAALGRDRDVLPWLESRRSRLAAGPRTASALAEERWPDALGRYDLLGEWQNLFRTELAAFPGGKCWKHGCSASFPAVWPRELTG